MRLANSLLIGVAVLSLETKAQVVEWEQDHLAMGEVDETIITEAGTVFAVTGAGLYRSTDKGESWEQVHETYVYGPVELPNGHLLAAEYFYPLLSTDGGATWEKLPEREVRSFFRDSTRVYAGGGWGQLWSVSEDLQTWTVLNQPVLDEGHLQVVALIYARGELLVYEHKLSGLWISRDGGQVWEQQYYYDPPAFLYPVGDQAYLPRYKGASWGIAGTTDFNSFTVVSGCPTYYPTAGAFHKNLFAVGALEGPYVSLDYGATWTLCAAGLENPLIYSLAVDEEGYLYAGTHSGIQRSKAPLPVAAEIPVPWAPFDLRAPFPNPFRTRTSLVLSVDHPQHLLLEVFNLAGQRVRVLEDRYFSAGAFRLDFDGGGLPAGSYILRALGEDTGRIQRLLLAQ